MADTNPKDTKTVLLYLIGAVVVLGILGFSATGRIPFLPSSTTNDGSLRTVEIKIADHAIQAEVAETDSTRQKGLSGHAPLAAGEGMLFVFPEENVMPAFWMKGVTFPIDIVWINDDKVVQIDTVQPQPDTADANLTLYNPSSEIDHVLELPANFAFNNEIKIGDSVDLRGI